MTRQITIEPVLNGWLLRVGCQQVVFTDKQTMLNELSNYYDKPEETEKRFIERAANRIIPLEPPSQPVMAQEQCVAAANVPVTNRDYDRAWAVDGLRRA